MAGWWLAVPVALALALVVWRWRAAHVERIALRAELLRLREALHAAERQVPARQEQMLLGEAAFDALVLANREREVLALNQAARDLFDPAGDLLGSTVIALTRNHEIDALVGDALSGSDDLDRQIVVDGRPYRVRAVLMPGSPVRRVAIGLHDVSELQRLARARRDMVANISHELRTPISSIRLLVETLAGGALRDKTEGPELLDKIAAENATLQQMAQELLDLSMIESGKAMVRLVPQPVTSLLSEAIERLSEQANRKEVAISHEGCADLMVLADRELALRVLTNLLHNAIKYAPEKGHIAVACRSDGEWLQVSVTDDGPGIPFADRERVFERFYRADKARGGPGTGLGLAIAKHVVEAHGGRIWVAERGIGERGAQLVFTLPLPD